MSRPIKFRAWDKIDKRMMYRDVFDRNWYATPKNDEGGCHTIRSIHPDDKQRVVLMQFTGLNDKNGKEIWEGDIVKYWHESELEEGARVTEIEWCGEDYPAFDLKHNDCTEINGLSNYGACGHIEVLGNIYENPELLNA